MSYAMSTAESIESTATAAIRLRAQCPDAFPLSYPQVLK